jgi:hypothetical protein
MHLFRPIIQKEGHMMQPMGKKTFTLISNVPGNGLALSWFHQSPPTKMGENPIKTWNL